MEGSQPTYSCDTSNQSLRTVVETKTLSVRWGQMPAVIKSHNSKTSVVLVEWKAENKHANCKILRSEVEKCEGKILILRILHKFVIHSSVHY